MEASSDRKPDWYGVTVFCRECRGRFTLNETVAVHSFGARIRRNEGSVGVVCPHCKARLIVRYDRRWKTLTVPSTVDRR